MHWGVADHGFRRLPKNEIEPLGSIMISNLSNHPFNVI